MQALTLQQAAAFAEAVGMAVDRALVAPEPWRPGAVQDESSPALSAALAGMGWLELADDAGLLPLAGLASLELGRRLAPLSDLVRHGATTAVDPDGVLHVIDAAEPVPYGDALGVHRVLERHEAGQASET